MLDITPALRLYGSRRMHRLKRMRPAETQEGELLRLVRRAAGTRFGRDHGFDRISSVADFQNRVPIRRYEEFRDLYWGSDFPHLGGRTWPEPAPYFAISSGTSSGPTKYIPVTRQMVRSNRRAGLDVVLHHLANRPRSRLMGGRNLMLGGSLDLTEEAPGIYSGDLTAIASREMPRWVRPFSFPPPGLVAEGDWEHRIDRVAAASIGEDIRNIAGTASWLLLFFEKLAEVSPGDRRLARFFPQLEMVVHGGVAFEPYRTRFEAWLEGSGAELREVYPASEGFVAMADRGSGEGLRLNTDGGIFFEFVPVGDLDSDTPVRHWIGNAEAGQEYAVILSSCAGLWAYALGDTVRFVDLDPPRLFMTGRTSYFLSAFGEHLTGQEIDEAVIGAVDALGATVAEYAAGAYLDDGDTGRGGHLFVIELAGADPALVPPTNLAADIDARLTAANRDYGAHRAGDYGMHSPQVILVRPGAFADWMRERGKLGGQNKVPRVVNDRSLFESLQQMAEANRVGPP